MQGVDNILKTYPPVFLDADELSKAVFKHEENFANLQAAESKIVRLESDLQFEKTVSAKWRNESQAQRKDNQSLRMKATESDAELTRLRAEIAELKTLELSPSDDVYVADLTRKTDVEKLNIDRDRLLLEKKRQDQNYEIEKAKIQAFLYCALASVILTAASFLLTVVFSLQSDPTNFLGTLLKPKFLP